MARSAYSLDVLLRQINAMFPNRPKESDGGLGNAEHAARESDHNPDGYGVYHARDFTKDWWTTDIVKQLVASRDSRIKYIIWEGRIIDSHQAPWLWQPYYGVNGHYHHFHISVMSYNGDSTMLWKISNKEEEVPLTSDEIKQVAVATATETFNRFTITDAAGKEQLLIQAMETLMRDTAAIKKKLGA